MDWKSRVLKFLKLKANGVIFNPNLYDYIYIYKKKSIGLITEIHSPEIFSISFFRSLNNTDSFHDVMKMDREKDLILPRYENLLKAGHIYLKKLSGDYQTGEFEFNINTVTEMEKKFHKFKIYGRLQILFKRTGDVDDYENLLNLIIDLIRENQSRHSGRY